MERVINDIKQQLENVAGKCAPAAILTAQVLAVNGDDTISVELASELIIEDVRLKSVVASGDKIIIVPSIGSYVQIAAIENSHEYVVVATEAISKVQIIIGGTEFVQDGNKFTFKKGSDSLAKVIGDLIDELNKVVVMAGTGPNVAALNAIKKRLNQMMQ